LRVHNFFGDEQELADEGSATFILLVIMSLKNAALFALIGMLLTVTYFYPLTTRFAEHIVITV
jgi:hypothetical protein